MMFEYITADEHLRVGEYLRRLRASSKGVTAEDGEKAVDALTHEVLNAVSGNLSIEVMFALSLSQNYADEKIAILERALEPGAIVDIQRRSLACREYIHHLCREGEIDRAETLADTLPLSSHTREFMLPIVYAARDEKKGRDAARHSIKEMSNIIAFLKQRFGIDD